MEKKRKTYLDKYTPIKEIGKGGNAKVFLCNIIDDETNKVALKDLDNNSAEKKARFIDEINIMAENCNLIEGILPILDSSKEYFWYTMPLATSVIKDIRDKNRNIVQIVEGVIQITETLSFLHNKGISHRDIKPSNIYVYIAVR